LDSYQENDNQFKIEFSFIDYGHKTIDWKWQDTVIGTCDYYIVEPECSPPADNEDTPYYCNKLDICMADDGNCYFNYRCEELDPESKTSHCYCNNQVCIDSKKSSWYTSGDMTAGDSVSVYIYQYNEDGNPYYDDNVSYIVYIDKQDSEVSYNVEATLQNDGESAYYLAQYEIDVAAKYDVSVWLFDTIELSASEYLYTYFSVYPSIPNEQQSNIDCGGSEDQIYDNTFSISIDAVDQYGNLVSNSFLFSIKFFFSFYQLKFS
jgi:hypothetical protein